MRKAGDFALQPTHRGTPPEDVIDVAAGLLAHGSPLLPGLPSALGASDRDRLQLAVYSCGNSSGLANAAHRIPSSLWRLPNTAPENHDTFIMEKRPGKVNAI